ncbi:RHS repeat-associated core domain-containing protein [Lysinibacillus sp. FSL L8-0126]
MQYNELGQEIERILPGDVISKWQYDITGRPTHHRVSSQNRDTRRRVYNWDVNHQLRSMVNELTGIKVTYGYDEFSNLVWSNQGGQFDFLYRSVDDVGNLYETKDKKDRIYGAGSRLLETKDAKFSYDEEGNLVEKVEKNGDTWKYEYYGNGMMAKVMKPDKVEVTFKYDSLGRRIEKRSEDKVTHFVWDGNTTLHEWNNCSEDLSNIHESLITWVYDNKSFNPIAKITREGVFSIIRDYLGTPVEAYDTQGKKIWTCELDIYGRVKKFIGEKDFIPFRYQGQYEDEETGLYYNRFRYYSASEGIYTQSDPIGLAGNNPTLYGYVSDTNRQIDVFGLMPLSNPVNQGHHMVPHTLATKLGIQPFNSQTGVPALYFSSEQWLEGEGLNHSAMHGYNELGAGTKPVLTENQFKKSGLTNQEWIDSLQNHYNNSEIQKFKGDLHVINSDGTKGKLLKADVTPALAWEETKEWASQKGYPINCQG